MLQTYKYIVVKKCAEENKVYEVYLHNDIELTEHIRGTIEDTDHEIISIINIRA
jgi:hypothetical protein